MVSFVPTTIRTEVDDSYLRRWDGAFLEGLAAACPDPARIVEIGRGRGFSLLKIMLGLSLHEDAKVWSIDIEECEQAVDKLRDAQIPNWRYEVLLSDSVVAASAHWEPLDMIYFDGRHSYEGVKEDVKAWQAHLKVGGVAVFHDYKDDAHEVTAAVDEMMAGWRHIGLVGVVSAYEKAQ